MALAEIQQIQQILEGTRHILITFRKDGGGDAIGSAVALSLFLEKQGKKVDLVVDDFILPKKFAFLPKAADIQSTIPHLQKFLITIDVKDAGVEELSYDVKDQKLQIFVTPKSGFLTSDHVKTAQSEFRYDLIIILDSPDLQSLGVWHEKHTELFQQVPVINIDHKPSNEHFGQINLVDITASATAEVVANLMAKLSEVDMNTEIATALLTGMIVKTKSFKGDNIKPQSLSLASSLMHLGANREEIIHQLYQTKTLSTLRLWGEALAHLNFHKPLGLVSTLITRDNFVRSGATEKELYEIVDEIMISASDAKMILILHEHADQTETQIHGILYTEKGYQAKELVAIFQPQGDARQVSFVLKNKTLTEAEELVVEEIRKKMK